LEACTARLIDASESFQERMGVTLALSKRPWRIRLEMKEGYVSLQNPKTLPMSVWMSRLRDQGYIKGASTKRAELAAPRLPQDLSKASKKQLKDTIDWLSQLPLKELRKRQDLTNAQIRQNFRAYEALNEADQKDPDHRVNMAARNLEIMSTLLIQAVSKSAFGD
jgi:hypothetical protein